MNRLDRDICIIGLGPSGIGFINEYVTHNRQEQIICLEGGKNLSSRHCQVLSGKACIETNPCNVVSGFGGASLMAGGKLSLYPAGAILGDILGNEKLAAQEILESLDFYQAGIPLHSNVIDSMPHLAEGQSLESENIKVKNYKSYLYDQKYFYSFHESLLQDWVEKGVDLRFSHRVVRITKTSGKYFVYGTNLEEEFEVSCNIIVLALGKRSFENIHFVNLIELERKRFANKLEIGVRLEFPLSAFPDIDKYHGDLKLKNPITECKTFCVSKGGKVALYLKDGLLFTEGYENPETSTNYTNLAILKKLKANPNNLTLYDQIIKKLNKRKTIAPIRQNLIDFLNNTRTDKFNHKGSISYFQKGNIAEYLEPEMLKDISEFISEFVDSYLRWQDAKEYYLYFPEMNYGGYFYEINENFMILSNFYLIGESTGQFLGILQCHSSGRICAKNIMASEKE